MNDVIEKLSSFVETQYLEHDSSKNVPVGMQNDVAFNTNDTRQKHELEKEPNNSEVYEALNVIYPKTEEIAIRSLEEYATDSKTEELFGSPIRTAYTSKEPPKQPYERSRNNGIEK